MIETIQKGEIPFVRILIPLIFGISMALCLPPTINWFNSLQFLLIGSLVIFVICHVFYKKLRLYRWRWITGILLFLFIGICGYEITTVAGQRLEENHFSKLRQEFLLVNISSEPKVSGDIVRFETKAQQSIQGSKSIPSVGNLLIALKVQRKQAYRYGDLLLIPAKFNEVEPPFNPYEFDFRDYLSHKAIYHQTFINEHQIKVLKHDQGNFIIASAIRLRQKLVERFNKFIAAKDAAAVASTLILGYRADLSKEVLSAYSATGTMHVLSVSGMHVGIVFFVLTFLLKSMDRTRKFRLMKAVLILVLIWAYSCVTGFSSAVCRAALMLSFVIIGKAINKSQNTYNLVAVSAVILLIYNPFFLVDVGFQLSYLAVLGLVYLYPKIYHAFYIKNYVFDKIWSYSALSIAAQLATFPLSLYYFHQFPLNFLFSNLFIVLPVTLIMYGGLLFVLLPFDWISQPLGWLLQKLISFTNSGLHYLENLPFSVAKGIWVSSWEYLLIYLFIFVCIYFFALKKKPFLITGLLLILVFVLNSSLKIVFRQKENKVIFYSLRKKSAIGFIEGRQAFFLTNLSEDDKTYLFSVQPFIDAELIKNTHQLSTGETFSKGNFLCDSNFIQFRNWKMVIWNKRFDFRVYKKKLAVHAVLLSDNPGVNLASLVEFIQFQLLLIDGTNSDYKISRWVKQAKDLHLNYYVLKKNPAYIVALP